MNQQDYDSMPECRALWDAFRRTLAAIFACLPVILLAAGCASTRTTEHEVLVSERLPRPSQIWVDDFAATAAAVPPESTLARKFTVESMPQTAEQMALGQRWAPRSPRTWSSGSKRWGCPPSMPAGARRSRSTTL